MAVASLMSSPVLRAALADPLLGPDLLWKLDASSSSDTVPSTPRLIPGRGIYDPGMRRTGNA